MTVRPGDLVVGPWGARFLGRDFACAIGRGGITEAKREGDGATPAGIHRIAGVFFRADRLALATPRRWTRAIGPRDGWSDDVADPAYNHLVRRPHPFSHEALRRPDPLYDLVLVTDWNWPEAEAGRGSAIFVHTWRRPRYPTEGCVAFARPDLFWIARRLVPGSRLVVRQP